MKWLGKLNLFQVWSILHIDPADYLFIRHFSALQRKRISSRAGGYDCAWRHWLVPDIAVCCLEVWIWNQNAILYGFTTDFYIVYIHFRLLNPRSLNTWFSNYTRQKKKRNFNVLYKINVRTRQINRYRATATLPQNRGVNKTNGNIIPRYILTKYEAVHPTVKTKTMVDVQIV